MSNHSSDIDPKMKQFLESINKQLGPTKQFPEGKLTDKDEGEIAFAIGVVNKKVVINFGSPVAWFGMLPSQAIELGEILIKHGRSIQNSEFK